MAFVYVQHKTKQYYTAIFIWTNLTLSNLFIISLI